MTTRVSHRPFVSGNYLRAADEPGLIEREDLTPIVAFEPMFGKPADGLLNAPAYARFGNDTSPDREWLSHEDLLREVLAQSYYLMG